MCVLSIEVLLTRCIKNVIQITTVVVCLQNLCPDKLSYNSYRYHYLYHYTIKYPQSTHFIYRLLISVFLVCKIEMWAVINEDDYITTV